MTGKTNADSDITVKAILDKSGTADVWSEKEGEDMMGKAGRKEGARDECYNKTFF